MSTSGHTVELITTKEIDLFLPLMAELADHFGDRFLLSMLHWCEIGKRPKPLQFWEVFLLQAKPEIIGVCGLYRAPDTPLARIWLGWFGIRPQFRRKGHGSAAIHALAHRAHAMGCTDLWVYTGQFDQTARSFYTKLGFKLLGPARDYAPGQTMDDSDIVLKLQLVKPLSAG